MILKRDLLKGLDTLAEKVFLQGEEIAKLKARLRKLEPEKRKPGRPRKTAK